MGKVKAMMMEEQDKIAEIIRDCYMFDDFYSRDSFRTCVYNRLAMNGIKLGTPNDDFIKETIEEILEM